ncbi:MAG: gamma-glutamyl kinase [Pseudomonadota bacterium]
MLIFYRQRLVLLAVPKTGTTAYHRALASHADMVIANPPALKHAPVYRYNRFFRPMFERVCGAEMVLAAVMREPVSWLGSWYRYRKREALIGTPQSTKELSFDQFVLGYLRGEKPPYAAVGSQAQFLKAQPNGTAVSHLFQYEEPLALHRFLEERLDFSFELQRLNVSPPEPLDLSPDIAAKLRRKYAADFALYASISGEATA